MTLARLHRVLIACGILLAGNFISTQALTEPCQEDFGSTLTDPMNGNSSVGLFLNFENRAQCNGTVTAYHYCYYDLSSANRMNAFFMVFRENGNEYSLVEGSHREVTRTRSQVDGFGCNVEQLELTQRFEVQENDIVAACTVDPPGNGKGHLHVYASNTQGHTLHKLSNFDINSRDSCSVTEVNTIAGTEEVEFALHVFAEIEVEIPSVDVDDEVTNTAQQSESLATSTGIGTPIPSTSSIDMDDEVTSTAQQTESLTISTGIGTRIPSSSVVDMDVEVTSTALQSESLAMSTGIGTPIPSSSVVDMDDEVTSTAQQSESLAMSTGIGTPIPSSSVVDLDDEVTSTAQQTESPATSTGIGTPIPSTSVVDMDEEVTSTALPSEATAISTGLATESPVPSGSVVDVDVQMTSTATQTESVVTSTSVIAIETTRPLDPNIAEISTSLPAGTASSSQGRILSAQVTVPPFVDSPPRRSDGGGLNVAAIVVPVVLIVVGGSVGVSFVALVAIARKKKHKTSALTLDNVVYALDDRTYEVPNHLKVSGPLDELEVLPLSSVDCLEYVEPADAYCVLTTFSERYYSTITSPMDYAQLLEQSKEEDIYGDSSPYQVPATSEDKLYAELKSYGIKSIPKQQIEIAGHLGSGQFGNVDKGIWATPYGIVDVAVKTLSADGDTVKFLQEAAIMAQFRHPNVVLLHGVVCRDKPLMLVVELVHNGDLRQFLMLKRNSSVKLPSETQKLLLDFSAQVALGMHYLSSKGFVHRDLAARNILVSKEHVCKVADFGLTRDLEHGDYYVSTGGKVPVKWTAPEALHYKKYSTASDVWSYGCLLYEIWSLGHKPLEAFTNAEVVQKIVAGFRLPPPPGCVRPIYELMIQCWHPDPSHRPDFRSLLLTLLEHRDSPLTLTLPEGIHPQAGTLGAPLEAGEGLYPDLQSTYMTSS